MSHSSFPAQRTRWVSALLVGGTGLGLLVLCVWFAYAPAWATSSVPDNLGSISGTINDASGAPLAQIEVYLYAPVLYNGAVTRTAANGAYSFGLLPPGVYQLQFADPNQIYATQWYAHRALRTEATEVVVAGNQVTAINDTLTLGAHISGTVTVQQAGPATNGDVRFYLAQAGQWQVVSTSTISRTGQYQSAALLPGVYRLCARFYVGGAGEPLTGCYGGPDVEHASDIPLTALENKAPLNLDIGVGEFNGVLSGVVRADGAPRADIKVSVYSGSPYYEGPTGLIYSFTDSAGHYTFGGLAAGTYRLGFADPAGLYATTYYTQVPFLADAPLIALEASQVISPLNVTLAHGGSIQGHVQRYTAAPIPNVTVTLLRHTDTGSGLGWYLTEIYTTTDAAGNYTLRGLWPGVYRLGLQCHSDYEQLCAEYYGAKRSVAVAKDVAVQADHTTTGIDVTFGIENPSFLPLIQRHQ